ncbi:hypothetical protein GN316_05905 [Xylophilus sp. Kf1]|nr:hypothetical protein [Xylophilus sp. Kf1]
MAFFPALLSGQLFKSVEKIFNSPEHNFKMDLDDALEQAGVSKEDRREIKNLLNTGTDAEIGEKLNALLAAGVIPPQMTQTIDTLAQRDGVSRRSIDPDRIGEEMDALACGGIIGGAFAEQVDAMAARESGQDDGRGDAFNDLENA